MLGQNLRLSAKGSLDSLIKQSLSILNLCRKALVVQRSAERVAVAEVSI